MMLLNPMAIVLYFHEWYVHVHAHVLDIKLMMLLNPMAIVLYFQLLKSLTTFLRKLLDGIYKLSQFSQQEWAQLSCFMTTPYQIVIISSFSQAFASEGDPVTDVQDQCPWSLFWHPPWAVWVLLRLCSQLTQLPLLNIRHGSTGG